MDNQSYFNENSLLFFILFILLLIASAVIYNVMEWGKRNWQKKKDVKK